MEDINVNANEIVEEVVDTEQIKSSGLTGLAIALGIAVVGSAGAIIYKNRDKIEKKRIEKLVKKGYLIYEPGDNEAEDEPEED